MRQRRNDCFRRDVADQFVAGEWAAPEPRQRAIESPATCLIRRQNFCCGIFRAAVQMNAEFHARDTILHGAV